MIILKKQALQAATIVTTTGRCIGVAETVSGTIDGSNQVFYTTYDYEPGAISLLYNGQALHSPDDFLETGPNEITLTYLTPETDDVLRATYGYDECLEAGAYDTLIELTDTPAAYDDGKYLRSTAIGTEWASSTAEFARYYIEPGVTVLVNDYGQYVIEHGNFEVAGTLELGTGAMLIINID